MAFPIIYIILATVIFYLLRIRYHGGMNKFNGPFLASFTDFWKVWYTYTNGSNPVYVDLHKKYGNVVRVGPNELSFADPRAIHEIYGPRGVQQKSKEYAVTSMPVRGELTDILFSTLDTEWHDRHRRLVTPAFSMSQMIKYEPCVDENISLLIEQLRKRFVSGRGLGAVMDVMNWATYWSLEVIYDLTFGERIGYVEQGKDVNNLILGVRKTVAWHLYFTRAPILDYLTIKNPILLWFNRHGWFESPNVFMPIVQRQFIERQEHWKEVGSLKTKSMNRPTLTELFLKAQQDHPEVPDFQPFMHSMSIIGAATEATAIAISSIIYYVLKHSDCYTKLKAELFALPSNTPISFSTAQSLPYLNAVVNESMRLHIADKFPRGREVPVGGMKICNHFIPGGVTVSVYADVAHRRKDIFGDDVDVFRPERWLESEEKTSRMLGNMLSFGSGRFGCLGRNLARVEVLKFVPSVLREFEFELVNKKKEWTLVNGPFPHPVDLLVTLRERD